jgi:hypothetical protein
MSSIAEIIIFFVKEYINKDVFEKWVYEKTDLESFLGSELYLDVISVDFSKKEEVIHLKNNLKRFITDEKLINIDEINDGYCEKFFNQLNVLQLINRMDNSEKQVYELLLHEFVYPVYREEVIIDLINIRTEKELMRAMSRGLGMYRFPMEWKWFGEYLKDCELPTKIMIKGIDNIKRNFSGCYYLIKDVLGKVCEDRGCSVDYY